MATYSLKSSTTQASEISLIALVLCTLAFTFTGLFANAQDTDRLSPSTQMTSTDSTARANGIAQARYLRSIYKTDQAIELLYGLITPGAIESEVFSEIAECHIQNGENEAAEGIYYMVTSQNPDNLKYQIRHFSVLIRLKAYQTAAVTGRKVLALDSIPAIMTLTGDCWNYMESYDSALVYYNMSLRHKPMNESVVSKAAKIHLGRQEYGMVISMADSLLALSPDNKTIAPIKGLALYLSGNYKSAITVLERQKELGNSDYGIHFNLGQCYWKTNAFGKAITELETAWQIDSSDVNLAYTIASAKAEANRPFESEVKPWLEKALAMLEPDHTVMSRIHQQYGRCYFTTQSRWDDAIRHYKAAYKYNPKFISALSTIGYCYERKKDYKTALESYEKYLALAKPGTSAYNFVTDSIKFLKGELFMEE